MSCEGTPRGGLREGLLAEHPQQQDTQDPTRESEEEEVDHPWMWEPGALATVA